MPVTMKFKFNLHLTCHLGIMKLCLFSEGGKVIDYGKFCFDESKDFDFITFSVTGIYRF